MELFRKLFVVDVFAEILLDKVVCGAPVLVVVLKLESEDKVDIKLLNIELTVLGLDTGARFTVFFDLPPNTDAGVT